MIRDGAWWHSGPMRSPSSFALLVAPIAALSCWSGGNRNGPPAGSGVGTVTTCSGTHAILPVKDDLPVSDALPDPFLSLDGMPITKKDQWSSCRRAEIAAQAAAYELGEKPGKPASVTGSAPR